MSNKHFIGLSVPIDFAEALLKHEVTLEDIPLKAKTFEANQLLAFCISTKNGESFSEDFVNKVKSDICCLVFDFVKGGDCTEALMVLGLWKDNIYFRLVVEQSVLPHLSETGRENLRFSLLPVDSGT